jgi:ankyrin repeat protein
MTVYDLVTHRRLGALRAALASGADPDERAYGTPVIHMAVELDWVEGLCAFVAAGADLNLADERGDTPLMIAVIHKKPAVAQALIDGGADLERRNANGFTPLSYVVRMNAGVRIVAIPFTVIDGVQTESADRGPDLRANAMAVARVLLAAGAAVDAEDRGGMTALHYAAGMGDLEFASLLLDGGARVTLANANGSTALHAAASQGHRALVQLLLERGAAADAADAAGFTPLHEAAGCGAVDVVRMLLSAGADPMAKVTEAWKDIDPGMTPGDVARLRGRTDIVSLLT